MFVGRPLGPLHQRYLVPAVFPIYPQVVPCPAGVGPALLSAGPYPQVAAVTWASPSSWFAASSMASATEPAWSVMENAAATPASRSVSSARVTWPARTTTGI